MTTLTSLTPAQTFNKYAYSASPALSPTPIGRKLPGSPSPSKRPVTPLSFNDKLQLKVKHVIGTTASSSCSFCVVGNQVAYIAGSGVVLSRLEKAPEIGGHINESVEGADGIDREVAEVVTDSTALDLPGSPNVPEVPGVLEAPGVLEVPNALEAVPVSEPILPSHVSISSSSVSLPSPPPPRLRSQRFFCTSPQMLQNYSSDSIYSFVPSSPSKDSNGFPIGAVALNTATPDDQTISRMKTTSCVALSPDGKLLATGELGHQPRVLIYSTAWDSGHDPLAILSEHSFGIKSLAFSPCGKYLASLGHASDGFVYIWSLANIKDGDVTLHSTNKCISTIHDMKWVGTSLITVGVRHIRVWKVDSTSPDPGSKANVLSGRNIVLGEFASSNFVLALAISNSMALVVTDRGELASLQDISQDVDKPKFIPRISLGFQIMGIDLDAENQILWLGGARNELR